MLSVPCNKPYDETN